MRKVENKLAARIIIITVVIAICAIAIAYIAPIMKDISTTEGQIVFKEKIENAGIFGMLLVFLLEVAQIFLVIIPGEPLELLAGMCYGAIGGTVFITVSVFITTTILVFMVRKYGRKFVIDSFGKEKVEKIENSKLLNNPKKVEMIMIILFLIPGTPKDLLSYIGGLLPIKPLRFILISTFARFPSVISSTIAGENLVNGNPHITAVSYIVSFIFTAVILILINIFDKDKQTSETLKALK